MDNEIAQKDSDWTAEELKIINDTLTFIGNPIPGDPVTEIGRYLAEITGVKYLLIGRFTGPEKTEVQTVCFFNRGQQLANITYKLQNTPCNGVLSQKACYYPFNVQQEFPEDADLVIMGVTSYLGTALKDYSGKPMGLIVLLHDQTIESPTLIEYLMTIVSPTVEKHLAGLAVS